MAGVSAEIVSRCESGESFVDAHTVFTIRVRKGWSLTTVKRRYSDFASLDKQMRPRMNALPEMPPKSFFKKVSSALLNDLSFMNERQRGLGKLLDAMISLDPALRTPELREFLAVPSMQADGR